MEEQSGEHREQTEADVQPEDPQVTHINTLISDLEKILASFHNVKKGLPTEDTEEMENLLKKYAPDPKLQNPEHEKSHEGPQFQIRQESTAVRLSEDSLSHKLPQSTHSARTECSWVLVSWRDDKCRSALSKCKLERMIKKVGKVQAAEVWSMDSKQCKVTHPDFRLIPGTLRGDIFGYTYNTYYQVDLSSADKVAVSEQRVPVTHSRMF